MDEKTLVARVLAGDQDAIERFYMEHQPGLYRSCVHFLGREERDAEDIVQETIIIALRKLGGFEFKCKLSSWVTQICINLCYERLRERKRTLQALEAELDALAVPQAMEKEAEQRREEAKQERLRVIREQMRFIGEKCREVIKLRDEEGGSYIGISRALRVPIGTVMSRLARCRDGLRRLVLAVMKEAG